MILTLCGAVLIGLTLGALGSGGSAITVPIFIYLVGHEAKQSIAESMAIVGLISLVAAVPYAKAKQVDWHSVLYFGIPGMFGTFIGSWAGGYAAEATQLVVFGAVLMLAAYAMLRRPKSTEPVGKSAEKPRLAWIPFEGLAVGCLTGFVGVGGGFLIVPALVVLIGMPMRLAVGTSLVIITVKAAVGFVKYEHYLLTHDMSVDARAITLFVVVGALGSFVGKLINRRLNQRTLRQAFAIVLIVIGSFVILNEGGKLIAGAPQPARPSSVQLIEEQGHARHEPKKEIMPCYSSISMTKH